MYKNYFAVVVMCFASSQVQAGSIASTSDVVAGTPSRDATQAFGAVAGNDKPDAALNLLNDESFGGSDKFGLDLEWSFVGDSEGSTGGPFLPGADGTSGTLTFDTAQTGAFAITLKAANAFSIYYFDETFAGTNSVTFNTVGTSTNGNGKAQDLSHASLFIPTSTPSQLVPSPTAALSGLVMFSGLVMRRRRRD